MVVLPVFFVVAMLPDIVATPVFELVKLNEPKLLESGLEMKISPYPYGLDTILKFVNVGIISYLNKRTCPLSVPLPSFKLAPIATVFPSLLNETEIPALSFGAEPYIDEPTLVQLLPLYL